jgi:hypothetical protein
MGRTSAFRRVDVRPRAVSASGQNRTFINVCFRVLNKRTDDLSMKRAYIAWTSLDGMEGLLW